MRRDEFIHYLRTAPRSERNIAPLADSTALDYGIRVQWIEGVTRFNFDKNPSLLNNITSFGEDMESSSQWMKYTHRTRQSYLSALRAYRNFLGQDSEARIFPSIEPEAAPNPYDPTSEADCRDTALQAIKVRRGQRPFRDMLREIYGDSCAFTGSRILDVLEAAHIDPYRGQRSNVSDNGLLLRADIHTLFDCGLVGVHPEILTIWISPLLKDSEYAHLSGKEIRVPARASDRPSRLALEVHKGTWKER